MKIGAENKKQLRLMIALLGIALVVGIYNFVDFGTSSAAPPVTTASVQQKRTPGLDTGTSNLDPRVNLPALAWSQSRKYEAGRNIFTMEAVRIEQVKSTVRTQSTEIVGPPTPTPTPPPPPITLKFYGFASKPNEPKRIFLANEGGTVFIARQGEIVERKYKVVQINKDNVMIEDVLNNNRQPIPLTAK